ncbi:hypothetical protein ABVT39_008163 [Epinephelus coioides]
MEGEPAYSSCAAGELQLDVSASYSEDDVLDLSLDAQAFSDDKQDTFSSAQSIASAASTGPEDTSFFALCRRAAAKLEAIQLMELDSRLPPNSPLTPVIRELRIMTDYILRSACFVAVYLSRGMASTVVAHRYLWLTLSDIPDRDRVAYLGEPVSPAGLFGSSLDAIQANFELRQKQTEALRNVIPRRDARPRQPAAARKPMGPLPCQWRDSSASSGPRPAKQTSDQTPGPEGLSAPEED